MPTLDALQFEFGYVIGCHPRNLMVNRLGRASACTPRTKTFQPFPNVMIRVSCSHVVADVASAIDTIIFALQLMQVTLRT